MKDKDQDPSLQAPQEANTIKHINFAQAEENDEGTANGTMNDDNTSPTKKAWEELREENKKHQNNQK